MAADILYNIYSFFTAIASALGISALVGKLSSGVLFFINRFTGGLGTLFFHHKGRKTGRRRYYVVAIFIYVLSWVLIFLGSAQLWHWLSKLFRE
ncbi:MAG: hypothetical protein LHV69_06450 [Elusimicrobia bacterium]|nr:hypothetical protein [Candidatus Obscuribacterium magneticum]